jgi:hypothetical protein
LRVSQTGNNKAGVGVMVSSIFYSNVRSDEHGWYQINKLVSNSLLEGAEE